MFTPAGDVKAKSATSTSRPLRRCSSRKNRNSIGRLKSWKVARTVSCSTTAEVATPSPPEQPVTFLPKTRSAGSVDQNSDSFLTKHYRFLFLVLICYNKSIKYNKIYSTIQLGSLLEIQSFHAPNAAYHRFVRNRLTGVMKMCKGCMIEGQCGGGCNITQEFALTTKIAKIERMCGFYRRMTQEILREQLRKATVSEPALLQTAVERR